MSNGNSLDFVMISDSLARQQSTKLASRFIRENVIALLGGGEMCDGCDIDGAD